MASVREFKRWVYLFEQPTGLPCKKRITDAAYDILAHEEILIPAKSFCTVTTNVAIEIKTGEYGQLGIRYTYGHKGLFLTSTIIDSTYTGPLRAVVCNISDVPVHIKKYDRFLCIVIAPVSKTYPIYEIDSETHTKITKTSMRGMYISYYDDKSN